MANCSFIGLDLSYTNTGLSVIRVKDGEERKEPILSSVKTTPKESIIARQEKILATVKEVIEHELVNWADKDNIFIAIEGYAMGIKAGHICDLAELGGLCKYLLCKPYKTIVVPPTVLKKFITQKGNVNKNIVIKEIYRIYGQDINDDNIADAFALSKISFAFYGSPSQIWMWQKECIKNVKILLDK